MHDQHTSAIRWCDVLLLVVCAVLVFVSPCHAEQTPADEQQAAPPVERPGWKLTWSDEFDYRGQPDPDKWFTEIGFVRNKELQFYTRHRLENARVEDGCLVIEARCEHWPNPYYDPKSDEWTRQRSYADYTSASLITRKKAEFLFGRIEVRAEVPQVKGAWPAVWMLGVDFGKVRWPQCGEIDIMEFLGRKPKVISGTVHYFANDDRHSKGNHLALDEPITGFHLYAIEWTPHRMDFYFDDTKYHSVDLDALEDNAGETFRKPFYLLLNLAMGGWGGEVDDTQLPAVYRIDYVRAYQQEDQLSP